MTIRTSLLEARFILGDEALFEDMRARFELADMPDGPERDTRKAEIAAEKRVPARAISSRWGVFTRRPSKP